MDATSTSTPANATAIAPVDFTYEVEQLAKCIAKIRDGGWWNAQETVICNAVLESALVHVRGLTEYLRRPTATALVPSWSWSPSSDLGLHIARINTELAHLTAKRPPPGSPKKQWNVDAVALPVLEAAAEYSARAGLPYPEEAQRLIPVRAYGVSGPAACVTSAEFVATTAGPHTIKTLVK